MLRNTFATTDLLYATPSSANVVKTLVYFSDKTSTAYTGGNEPHSLAAASKATICATPASGVRDIDHVIICATGGANTIIVGQTVSGTDYQLLSYALASGDTLEYTHGEGWKVTDSNGAIKMQLSGAAVVSSLTNTGITTLQNSLLEAKGADIAAAATVDLATATGNYLDVTGNGGPITSLGTVQAGSEFTLNFTGKPKITHNGTSLILPGGADIDLSSAAITTLTEAWGTFVSLGGGNWRCTKFECYGTWSPAITFATPGDLSVTYTVTPPTANFSRKGGTTLLNFSITTATFTWSTASGSLRVTGIPFANGGAESVGNMYWGGITKAGYTQINQRLAATSVIFAFIASGSGSAATTVVAADVPSGGTVAISGSIVYNN